MVRNVYAVFGRSALSYAKLCVQSLFAKSIEPVDLTIITDAADDKAIIGQAVSALPIGSEHHWRVYEQAEADERADERFRGYEHLQAFRHGHPCWRKITDPPLFADQDQEIIILDPDVYFPNRFTFEPTPAQGVLLMWQRPLCLLPPEAVWHALNSGIELADHIDIGAGHWRWPIDLEYLDDLIGKLGGTQLPRIMHVEPIVWAALAMRLGGGYLNPKKWLCWRSSHFKRIALKLGRSPMDIMRREPLEQLKLFHAGGNPKHWLVEAHSLGLLDHDHEYAEPTPLIPYVRLSRTKYALEQTAKKVLHKVGYYKAINPAA